MMPNITKGAKPVGLMVYLLHDDGRHNEHEDQHVVSGSPAMMLFAPEAGVEVSKEQAVMLGRELDRARVMHGTDTRVLRKARAEELVTSGSTGTATAAVDAATVEHNVWHCSLSLHPDEPALSDEKWVAITHRFMELMEYHSPDALDDPETRWLAVRHGLSGTPDSDTRNDHVHIAASTVRDDGSRIDTHLDYRRAQAASAQIEREFDLRITAGRDERTTSKGTAPAQDQRRARTGRAEPARATLARMVRATAGAAESEAEFVRLVRAHGYLIRPRYADGSRDVVTGYSVALSTTDYATKTGAPVWHGGGKLGNDLSLPRLRESWIDDDGSRADAVSAWSHNRREPVASVDPPVIPKRAQTRNRVTFEAARDQLHAKVRDAAWHSRNETDFVGRVLADPDLLIRPRYATGSTTDVTGYSVALRPHLYAREDGKPQWHGGGKLHADLSLSSLRERWAPATDPTHVRDAWARTTGRRTPTADQWAPAADAANRWRDKVSSVDPTANPHTWATAAGDTAATVSAWALRAEADKPAELSRLADALADTAGHQRSPGEAARRGATGARRAAAMILAASHDDPMQAYRVMFAQIAAASRAIAAAAEARGQAQRAVAIRSALDAATRNHAAAVAATPQRPRRAPVAARTEPTRRPGHGRDDDYGR